MYITKDKNGMSFKWGKKGKNKECWVKNKGCITKMCFNPEDCGIINQKTQERYVLGICKTYFDGLCPLGYNGDNLPIKYKEIKGYV